MMKKERTLIALLLSLVMLLTASLPAMAETDRDEYIQIYVANQEVNVYDPDNEQADQSGYVDIGELEELEADISANPKEMSNPYGALQFYAGEADSSFTLDGKVTYATGPNDINPSPSDLQIVYAVDAESTTAETTLTITGDVSMNVMARNTDVTAVAAIAEAEGAGIIVDAQQDVKAQLGDYTYSADAPHSATAVRVMADASNSEAAVKVGGNVEASIGDVYGNNKPVTADGILLSAGGTGTKATADVTGSVAVYASNGTDAEASAIRTVDNQGGEVSVSVGKDAEAVADPAWGGNMSATVVNLCPDADYDADIHIAGNARARAGDGSGVEPDDAAVIVVSEIHDAEITIGGNAYATAVTGDGTANATVIRTRDREMTGEGEYQDVYPVGKDSTIAISVGGDVDAHAYAEADGGKGNATAAEACATEGSKVGVTMGKNVTATAEAKGKDSTVEAVGISAEGDGINQVSASGNVTANAKAAGENSKADAIGVSVYGDGTNTINVTGGVQANSETTESKEGTYAVMAEATGGSTNIRIDKDATASAMIADNGWGRVTAIDADSKGGASLIIGVGGTATASSTSNFTSLYAVQASAKGEDSLTDVTVGKGAEGMVSLRADDKGTVNLTVEEGGIKVNGDNVFVENNGGEINVDVKGGIEATGDFSAFQSFADGKSAVTTLALDGDITLENNYGSSNTAMYLGVENEAFMKATITNGTVSAAMKVEDLPFNNDDGQYVSAFTMTNAGGDIEVNAAADFSATGGEHTSGIVVMSEALDGEYEEDEDGTVIAQGEYNLDEVDEDSIFWGGFNGNEVRIYHINGKLYILDDQSNLVPIKGIYEEGTTKLTVTGDVTADQYGMELGIASEQTAQIIVDGTVSGDDAAIILYDGTVQGENLDLTVWSLESGEDGILVGSAVYEETGAMTVVQDKAAETAVNYIIRLAKSFTATLATANGRTVEIDGETELDTAVEDEDVTFTLDEGDGLDCVYYNEDDGDEKENNLLTVGNGVTKNDQGGFVLKMRRGGGMLLGLKTHKHEYEFSEHLKEPTCTEDGKDLYKCKYCDATKEVVVKAKGHKMTAYPAKDPTCTEDGNSAYWYCENCGKYFSDADGKNEIETDSWIIKAKGHKMTAYPAKDPTCTEDGNSAYGYCENCGKYFSDADGKKEIEKDSWIIKAKGHKMTAYPAQDPTCTEDGNSAYWYCEICGKYYSDAEGKNEIEKDSWIIKAGGHQLVAVPAVEPTTTSAGNTAYWYCPDCGKYYSDAEGKNEIEKDSWILDPLPEDEPGSESGQEPAEGDDGEEGTNPNGSAAEVLLTIIDKTCKTEIAFHRDGTYQATYEDGSSEKGKFLLKDGGIVLVNDGDAQTEMAITSGENGKYELTFRPSGDAETVYEFEIEEADVNTLIQNRS